MYTKQFIYFHAPNHTYLGRYVDESESTYTIEFDGGLILKVPKELCSEARI